MSAKPITYEYYKRRSKEIEILKRYLAQQLQQLREEEDELELSCDIYIREKD